MKIGPNNLINFYKTSSKTNLPNNSEIKKSTGINSPAGDRIEISENGVRHGEIAAAKIKLADSIEKAASEKRIQELREKINSGQYFIPSKVIADAILKK